jgi:biotin---protein ligase
MKIAIYLDEGVSNGSFQKLTHAFERILGHASIEAVNHQFFLRKNWEQNIALLAFPGGRDLPYHSLLAGRANRRIRTYVENGGKYLGICAGGYYGSSQIEFGKGTPHEIEASRELQFFPGVAKGPLAHIPFSYDDAYFKEVMISWQSNVLKFCKDSLNKAYYHGGCYFEKAEHFSSVEILARYHDVIGRPAAIVRCKIKQGLALLSGIHPEFSSKDLFQEIINKILT